MNKLVDKIRESGFVDASIDDWFYKDDVLAAVCKLKTMVDPATCILVDEIFGDLTKDFDDIYPED